MNQAANSTNKKRLQHIGSMIREARFCHGYTQGELAAICGLHENTIKRFESQHKGFRDLRITTLYRIMDALEMDLADALVDVE